jgi:hypothetical protein
MTTLQVRLTRFRGFLDAAIELKPLTILLGPNSAGKSSFGHALAAAAHAHATFRRAGYFDTSLTPTKTLTGQWPVDLGGLQDLRTSGTTGRVGIGIDTAAGSIEWGFGLDAEAELLLSHVGYPASSITPGFAAREPSIFKQGDTTSASGGVARSVQAGLLGGRFDLFRVNRQQWQDSTGADVRVDLDGLLLRAAAHPTGTPLQMEFGTAAATSVGRLLENASYLRAVRERPSRSYDKRSADRQLIGYGGEGTASVLNERAQTTRVRVLAPPALPAGPSQIGAFVDRQPEEVDLYLGDAVAYWLSRMKLLASIASTELTDDPHRLRLSATLAGQRPHDITEVGLGISQVLPVIVGGLLQPEDSLFIVDLPEAHLHPGPQADLADFFCAMALSGRSVLVETHSEMLFHRLRLRAALDSSLGRKIGVYFIDQARDGRCSQPREVGLDAEEQINWPVGFMEEALESETLLAAVRAARRRSK